MTEEIVTVKQGVITDTIWRMVPPTDLTGLKVHLVAKQGSKPHIELAPLTPVDVVAGIFKYTTAGTLPTGGYSVELQVYDDAGELIAISPSESYENLRVIANLGTVTP